MIFLQEQLTLISTQFHWLRPWWLLALIPALLLAILLWRQKHQAHQWQQLIAPELLPFLLDGKTITTKKSLLWALILAWFVSTIALAGPSWMKRPTPIEKNQHALVILLDLSVSMLTEDIKPSRLVRARLKIADILRERKDGQTALVVYAGEAHTVTPLSDDSGTIVSLLPALLPNIMPLQGSNTEAAIERGIQLLHDAGASGGDLLLITDGVVPEAFAKIRELLSNKKIQLNILGVGTNQAAPIASGNGGFLRDNEGAIITTQLNSNELNKLARQVNGRYSDIANTDSDINTLLTQEEKDGKHKPSLERDFDQWFDQGYWLVFLLLPIVLFSFRRGFILTLIFIPLLGLTPKPAYAFSLSDDIGNMGDFSSIWLTKDQQAQRALAAGDAKKAAEQFEAPDWKAAAQYRAGDYAAAAESYAKSDTANAHYNRGNALAKAGKLEDAITAYDEALKRDTTSEDAKNNRAIVEELLKQQKEKDPQKDSDKKDKESKDKDNKDQDKKDQDKKDQNQSDKQDQKQDDKNSQNEQDKNEQEQNDQQSEQDKSQNQESSAQNTNQQNQQSSAASQQQSAADQGQGSSSATSGNSQQMGQASSQNEQNKDPQKDQQAALNQNNLTEEQKQALEQWLRRVPDDPGGLLRNKFKYQYLQNRQKKADGEFESPKNNADQRW